MMNSRKECGKGKGDGGNLPQIRASYDISIPHPKRPDELIEVSLTLQGEWEDHLTLMFDHDAAPDVESTRDYYKIDPSLQVTGGGKDLHSFWEEDSQQGRGIDKLIIEIPFPRPQTIRVTYTLDLKKNDKLDNPREIGRAYKDRVLLTKKFAMLRGDELLAPFLPRGQARELLFTFNMTVPEGWEFKINAPGTPHGNTYTWELTFESPRFFGLSWFGVAGELICDKLGDEEQGVLHYVIAPKPEEDTSKDEPTRDIVGRRAVEEAKGFINYFRDVFGDDMLSYVAFPPTRGAGQNKLYFFVLPLPPIMERGAGGQYTQGTGYVFHSTAFAEPLSHTGGHEYFHAYNDGALESVLGRHSWFVEGYSETQATLQHLVRHDDTTHWREGIKWSQKRRAEAYKREIIRTFSIMNEFDGISDSLRQEGLLRRESRPAASPQEDAKSGQDTKDAPPKRSEKPLVVSSPLSDLHIRDLPEGGYNFFIRGRSFLLMHIIALIFESGAHYRTGFNGWFRSLYERFEMEESGAKAPFTYDDLVSTAFINAGEARRLLIPFFNTYIAKNTPFEYRDLVYWLQWAEAEGIFETLCEKEPSSSD